jgi:nucleoside-diphosphate-sugar epimerase
MDLLSRRAYLIDEGVGICNTVYVDNLVHAMWLAAIVERVANQEFIITDGSRVTWLDLYSAVAEAVGVDLASVPSIESVTLARLFREQRYAHLKIAGKRFAWAMRESLPSSVSRSVREILPSRVVKTIRPWWASYQEPGFESIQANNGMQPLPIIDREIASWQCCRYVLPIDKAQNLLGYEPPVTFSEGCRRTRDWIRFAFGMTEINHAE